MTNATEDVRPPPLGATLTDRRRPGRKDYQNPHLVAVLRGRPLSIDPAKAEADEVPKALPVDDLAAAPGMSIGAVIAATLARGPDRHV